jgi:type II secretory pathway pseudopilin PulG
MKQRNFLRSRKKGFILIESIVASAIIATAIVGILALLSISLRQAQIVKSQFIASMLALEGIEVVRAIRDENWINGRAWNEGLVPGDYQVQFDSTVLAPFSGNPLRFDPATGRYQYVSGENTEFVRRIIISNISADEIRVISRVSWQVRNVPFAIDAEDHLFNWLKQ